MNRTYVLRAIHAVYRASLGPARRRFERAAGECERAQEVRLRDLVAANTNSAYGRAHSFASINSVRDWQERVPIVHYEELEPWIARAAVGEDRVLTEAPVRIFERTSGSTAPGKLVPYTDVLLSEFGAATGPWLQDLYTNVPALRGTRSYWSISPVTRARERTAGGTPIGFEDDTEYFSPPARAAIRMTLAVPPTVAGIADITDWRKATVRHLAAAEDLGLISVWHPSFLTLLLRDIEQRLDEILDELPRTRAQSIRARLNRCTLGEALWPRLAIVSCWADGPAKDAMAALQAELPHARVQPKGLLATEGVVSIPLMKGDVSHTVAAITSHFLEFVDLERPSSRPLLAHELRVGATYAPIVSTGGGFFRYQLGDAVLCHGRYKEAPLLQFLGRIDQVSDLCGEKLNAVLVGAALQAAASKASVVLSFALLAPARGTPGTPPRYRLYAEFADRGVTHVLRDALERELGENHGYAYARALGQLAPLDVVVVQDGAARYQQARVARGERVGDIKPTQLDATIDCTMVFGAGADTVRDGAPV